MNSKTLVARDRVGAPSNTGRCLYHANPTDIDERRVRVVGCNRHTGFSFETSAGCVVSAAMGPLAVAGRRGDSAGPPRTGDKRSPRAPVAGDR